MYSAPDERLMLIIDKIKEENYARI